MHGAGNDFVMLDAKNAEGRDIPALAVKMCHRNFGVGGDGLIAVLPSDVADFRMRIFNSDGTEPEMCGNGIRCAVKFYIDNSLNGNKPGGEIKVETLAGILGIRVVDLNGADYYAVDMGKPILEPALVPVKADGDKAVSVPVEVNGQPVKVTCVSMGNPHAVLFFDDDEGVSLVETLGPPLEKHEMFPAKTNVEFARVISGDEIKMRVWERGVGLTLACGTGACATLVAANLNGLCGRKATLHLPGGDLLIEWKESGEVIMTGPAETVFTGEWLLD